MGDMISSGLNCPVKVTEIDNRTGQYCIPGETVSIAGRSISGDTTSHSEKLAANAENPAVIECYKYHLSSYENGNLEMDRSTSLSSDYFLSSVGSVADGSISRTPYSNLYTDYHIDSIVSCNDVFEECHPKTDHHELLGNKKKRSEKYIIQDECKAEICALACEKRRYTLPKQEHAFAGALSGVFVSICLHPVDTIKTVVQSCRAEQKSIYDIGKSIVSDRGLTGLYRGIATNIASSAPISAVYTFTYESVKGALLPLFPKEYYSFAHCVAGGCASIATSFIFTPSERIKQQMQVGSHYHSCWNAFVGIIRKGGLPSLYAGWGAVLCRNVPHSIVKFYTYESLKQFMLSPKEAGVQPTTLQTLVCGGIAGSTAALFTTPFDVVKTRLQTQIPGSMSQYNGVIHALQEIGKSEGLQGLYRGLTPRLIMYMSQGAIFFASYEFFKRLFSLESPQTDVQRIQYKQNMDNDPVLPSSIPSPSSQASSELHAQHS
ncbi:S-adenosylmethionine mitochondrial carrier protein [Pyrus x bretschneideri]|uniref:S-adenosylmethionine mitochondrial carrier protein n=1 Tax=Pyrus x bretschneideri TaxID=225117 RepID=UPI00202EE895|nr:S-adenosylmethionine mitochondrial carrier protein [Pyrus x bretschneideri]